MNPGNDARMRYSRMLGRSASCGLAWAVLVILVFYVPSRGYSRAGDVFWDARGALIAAPAIGVLAGLCSPLFRRSGSIGRVVIAVAALYPAAFLFLCSFAFAGGGPSPLRGVPLSRALSEVWNGTVVALTWTGLAIVLAPFAYASFAWVSKEFSPAAEPPAPRAA